MSGRKSFTSQLPSEVIAELHQRIRVARYGEHESLVRWLESLGYSASRSGMHRYATQLKRKDGYQGVAGSFVLEAALNDASTRDHNLVALYQAVGELEYRRALLIERIREITESKIY
ncbi:phage protein Gp27 family protein [Xenorhabdus nematophila]|uniref:phage protein Gp27 family protein n=1 Tax=Xenorhabdus nematophila TaxID=628 RepID=UPI0032B7B8ED